MKNLNQARINIMVSSMEQAVNFYTMDLGLKLINRYDDHYAEIDANGFMIALHPGKATTEFGDNMSVGFGVFKFDETMEDLTSKGIEFSLDKGGYIRLAHFKDPDGNCLFLAENK